MARIVTNLIFVRGDTFISPQWLVVNEALPRGITKDELEQGIRDGTYTRINFNDYNIEGMLRQVPNGAKLADLAISITDDQYGYLSWEIPYTTTESFPNINTKTVYDVQLTHKTSNVRETLIAGEVRITEDVTYNGPTVF